MAFLTKMEIERRAALEDLAAKIWGVRTPYPPPDVWGQFNDWAMLGQRIRQSAPEDRARNWARPAKRAAGIDLETAQIHAKLILKRHRMICPAPYLCWEHVAEFSERTIIID
jgi:hypothetical protein